MNRFAILGFAALVAGCTGDTDGKSTGDDTGMTDMSTTTECPNFYTGPVLVELGQVSCTDTTTVRYYVETAGWTSGGLMFAQETGNSDTVYASGQFADEHDLISYEFDACGAWDKLEQTLETGVFPSTPNESTTFSCEPNVHFDGSGVMSYAARVYDLDNNFADCLAWGHDPQGLIDGTYNRSQDPASPSELTSCVIGQPTR